MGNADLSNLTIDMDKGQWLDAIKSACPEAYGEWQLGGGCWAIVAHTPLGLFDVVFNDEVGTSVYLNGSFEGDSYMTEFDGAWEEGQCVDGRSYKGPLFCDEGPLTVGAVQREAQSFADLYTAAVEMEQPEPFVLHTPNDQGIMSYVALQSDVEGDEIDLAIVTGLTDCLFDFYASGRDEAVGLVETVPSIFNEGEFVTVLSKAGCALVNAQMRHVRHSIVTRLGDR